MKRMIFMLAVLVAGFAGAETPDERALTLYRKGESFVKEDGWPDARIEKHMLEALAVDGLSAGRRCGFACGLIEAYYAPKGKWGLSGAEKLYEAQRARKDFTNAAEIVRLTQVFADFEFNQFRVESAEKRIADLEKLPGVKLGDAVLARAKFAERKGDYVGAIAQYERILKGEVPGNHGDVVTFVRGLLWAENRPADVIELMKRAEADPEARFPNKECDVAESIFDAQLALKDYAGAEATLKKLLETPVPANRPERAGTIRSRAQAMEFRLALAKDDLARAHRLAAASKKSDQTGDLATRYANRGLYAKAVEMYELWWPTQTGWSEWTHKPALKTSALAYWRAGKRTAFAKVLEETVPKMKGVGEEYKLACRLAGECFRTGGLDRSASDRLFAGVKPEIVSAAIPFGAGLLVEVGLYEEPKMLREMRQALLVQHPRNYAAVTYVANAPTDAGSWFASGLMTEKNRHVNDVKFGQEAAERLVTDVNVIRGGKEFGEGSDEQKVDSWFYVCYDEQGIHLLFEHNDPKIKDVVRGKTRPTDYEMYFNLGEGQPVYQFGVNPLKREYDYCELWNSPHRFYRPLRDCSDFSSRATSYGFATAMNISWELAYHALPENGTEWAFEMIHWSRSGGVTWGGTDIWQVSNWGHWKFEGLTPEVKSRIRRVLMYKALARYQAQKDISTGGLIGHWKDAELGDPAFYETSLKPLVEELDAAAREAAGEPDDATVDRLFREAVPAWYDFAYYVAELREKYLTEKFLK